MKLSKIVVGGAQIANNYGIVGKNLTKTETVKVLNFLIKKNKKIYVDTSPYYGNSQNFIKNFPQKKISVISKIKNIPKNENQISGYIENFIQKLRKDIKKNIFCIFLHDEKDLDNLSRLRVIKKVFEKLKKKKIIKTFGYSIYDFQKYKKNILKIKPDILQFPYNLIDKRVSKKDFIEIKKNKIKIYVRSIFLQGLLLCSSKNLPKNFIKHSVLWKSYEKHLNLNKVSKLQAALSFVYSNKMIDKFIIGFKSMKEFKQILQCRVSNKKVNFEINDKKIQNFLINPRIWK